MLCPFHADTTPSLHVYPNNFHCFVCGAHGDHVDWLMIVEGKRRAEALRVLETWDGSTSAPVQSGRRREGRPHAGLCRADMGRVQTDHRHAGDPLSRRRARDRRRSVAGRRQYAALPPACPFGSGKSAPCLVALYRDVETDVLAGIHRVALTSEVFAGGKVERRTLGSWPAPRAIKLWPSTNTLFLGEGIETVLAAATRLKHHDKPMRPAWAAGSAGNITKFPVLADVKQLTLLVDHDASGQQSADTCRMRWYAAGRDVARLRPKRAGTDFNDLILERRVP